MHLSVLGICLLPVVSYATDGNVTDGAPLK